MTLIDTWLAVETSVPGVQLADALGNLNAACSTHYTHSHLSRWRRGIQQPSRAARDYMLRVCLADAVHQHLGLATLALTDEQIDALAAALSL